MNRQNSLWQGCRTFSLEVILLVLAIIAVAIPAAHAQTYSVLYDFGTKSSDPRNPSFSGIVAQGRDGNLYSTAPVGGTTGNGAMFLITPGGTLTVPYSFDATGAQPYSGLTLGTDGNFYGTTYNGGSSSLGNVFKLTPTGTLTVLHDFVGSDGSNPYAPPIQGTDGNFYGTTTQYEITGDGTVYKITPAGKFTMLYSFDRTHGQNPQAPLVQGTDGNFYGTTQAGGSSSAGVVYKITASGKLTVIHSFDGGTYGGHPSGGPLVQGSDGNFYGTAACCGSIGGGVVFKITAAGQFTVLHNINATTDGSNPLAGLVQATDGNFYGTTYGGGTKSDGTIFRISPTKPYAYKVLYNFDGTTGSSPQVTLLQHTNGILYGDTSTGGNINNVSDGVFYSLSLGLKPFVSLVSTSGKVGTTVEILGQGFTGTKGVSFNGTAAKFKVSSATYLTATVPNGATTGSVTVTTPEGKLTSNKIFRVTPQIISFKPTSGSVGTLVTITGVSLIQTKKVTFGGVIATSFKVNSDTQVTANVPTGAKTGKIAITTAGGIAVSPGVFTVTQ
jgi:uncharacterized repeat protein (TIGR03803 family)